MRTDLAKRCNVIGEIFNTLLPLEAHTADINELTAQVKVKESKKIKEGSLQSVQTTLSS